MSELEPVTSPHLREAEAALEAGDLQRAEASFRLHLQEHPDDAFAYNRLGVCLVRDERLQEAATAFEQAIALAPTLARAHTNLGNLRFAAGDLDEAERLHREAIRLDPDLAYAYENLAAVLKRQNRIGEAVRAQKQAAQLHARQLVARRTQAASGLGADRNRQRSWLLWLVMVGAGIAIYYFLQQ